MIVKAEIDTVVFKVNDRLGKLVIVSVDEEGVTAVCDCDNVVTIRHARMAHSSRPNQCFKCVKKGMQTFTIGKEKMSKYPVLAEEVSRAMIDNYVKDNV